MRRAGYETLFLHYEDTRSHAGRKEQIIKALYPRYIFVALRAFQGLYDVVRTEGVHSVVKFGGQPAEIPDEVIAELRKRGDKNGFCVLTEKEKKLRKRLRRKAKVVYKYDAFTELLGYVILDSGPAVSMWVNGRKVTVPRHTVSPVVAER